MENCMASMDKVNSTLQYKISEYILIVSQSYSAYHPIVALTFIILGISVGVLNLLILNFKKMVSPFNRMLSCIGITDMITMGIYAPFVIYFHIINKCALQYGTSHVGPARFLYCYSVLTALSHCASIWLAIGLSGLRLYCMKHPQQGDSSTWKKMIVITTTIMIMVFSISSIYIVNTKVELLNITSVNFTISENYILNQSGFLVIGFHGVCIKLIPSVMLTIIVIFMIKEFRMFNKRRKGLGKSSNVSNTTKMLIGVVLLFIIFEMPQGIIICMSAMSQVFYKEIYTALGDIVDLMTLIRTVANFFIYCSMSSMFRRYLFEILCRFSTCICGQAVGREPTSPLEGETIMPLETKVTYMKQGVVDTESEPEFSALKDKSTLLPSRYPLKV